MDNKLTKFHYTQSVFEDLYKPYPRKMGKSPAQRVLKGKIKSHADVTEFHLAVTNYKEHLKREGTDSRFVMYFDTFCRQYRDWLEADHGSVTIDKLDLSDVGFDT